MAKPLKRIEELQDLSRDHHQGLLLCWKIRTGFQNEIETERMMTYVKWFWENYLEEHFKIEEKAVFPVLDSENKLVKTALADHRRIKRLIENEGDLTKRLNSVEEVLEKHIRFEERVLFNEIQKIATIEELKQIQEIHHQQKFIENTSDTFWVDK